MNSTLYTCALTAVLFMACGNSDKSKTAERSTAPITTTAGDEQSKDNRDAYMKPYDVFNGFGGAGGKLVADINAGDGYFVWKLLKAGAQVIAVCETQAEVDALTKEKASRGIADKDLSIRLRPLGQTGLRAKEVDVVFLSSGLAGITDGIGYANKIFGGMKTGGIFCNLEWKPIESPVGPAVEGRYTAEQIMDLVTQGGFTDVASLGKTLPYHNLILGMEYLGQGSPIDDQAPAS